MSADRELMMLAAKAVGAEMTDYSDRTPDHWQIKHADGMWRPWHPLTDDGDALRLAVKLNMLVDVMPAVLKAHVIGGNLEFSGEALEAFEGDPYAATRRAIVRVAAEISKAMP